MKRMIEFADKKNLEIVLAYYPPYPRRLSENADEKLSSPNYFPGNFHDTAANCPVTINIFNINSKLW